MIEKKIWIHESEDVAPRIVTIDVPKDMFINDMDAYIEDTMEQWENGSPDEWWYA